METTTETITPDAWAYVAGQGDAIAARIDGVWRLWSTGPNVDSDREALRASGVTQVADMTDVDMGWQPLGGCEGATVESLTREYD